MIVLVTGGAGFVGATFIRSLMAGSVAGRVVNLDKLTYAGNLESLVGVSADARYRFVLGDICDPALVDSVFTDTRPDIVVNFAAETHVDRGILAPLDAVETNLKGTVTLLEAARRHGIYRFVQVSTDEVYGSLDEPLEADEMFPLCPGGPSAGSKAAADLMALAYYRTYRLPIVVTRSSNNYGPYQFPEKLVPLMIANALEGQRLPIYGDGGHVRNWLHVEDHCRALLTLLTAGGEGEVYNIAGTCTLPNIEVVRRILSATGRPDSLITPVQDRPGHDRRYAITSEKLTRETGWLPSIAFDQGLADTVDWYRTSTRWMDRVRTGAYREYYARNYDARTFELSRISERRLRRHSVLPSA